MSISFHGIGQVCATFLGDHITEGHVVKMSDRGAAAACSDGNDFFGVAMCCKDDACSVQVKGFVTVGYSGTVPAVGWTALAANSSGGVRSVSSGGRSYLVVNTDTTAKTVTIML